MSTLDGLVALQDHDQQIRELKKQIEDIPARKAQEEGRLKDDQDALEAAQQQLKACQAAVSEVELEIASLKEKSVKLRQQQMTLKTNKEFQAIDHEVEMIEGQIARLEDKELLAMESLEPPRARASEIEGRLVEEKASVTRYVQELDDRLSEIQAEYDRLEAERVPLAEAVGDARWLSYYNRVSVTKFPAVVKLQKGVCGGCHMTLPPAIPHQIRRKSGIVTCSFCSRILF